MAGGHTYLSQPCWQPITARCHQRTHTSSSFHILRSSFLVFVPCERVHSLVVVLSEYLSRRQQGFRQHFGALVAVGNPLVNTLIGARARCGLKQFRTKDIVILALVIQPLTNAGRKPWPVPGQLFGRRCIWSEDVNEQTWATHRWSRGCSLSSTGPNIKSTGNRGPAKSTVVLGSTAGLQTWVFTNAGWLAASADSRQKLSNRMAQRPLLRGTRGT
jgi:hypothetical protein